MATPAVVDFVKFFYPIGNTPAVCLTQDLPNDKGADILLLGCGDVRSILFTISADAGCDDVDGLMNNRIWDIYYHLYLDVASLNLLLTQTKKLMELSASLEEWHGSPYGKILRFCDGKSLESVRAIWTSILTFEDDAQNRKYHNEGFKSNIQKSLDAKRRIVGSGMILTGFRSVQPLAMQAMEDFSGLYDQFWLDGTLGRPTKPSIVNPTFASSDSTLHYGTDPLLGFHLATAYASIASDSDSSSSSSSSSSSLSSEKVVRTAQSQFKTWSIAFKMYAAASRLTIRFFAGDALAFCHTLRGLTAPDPGSMYNCYRAQYDPHLLFLDGVDYKVPAPAPLVFDIIDTSNLADHIGALNVLTATSVLLKSKPWSTLYTEVLVRKTNDSKTILEQLLCGHCPTIALLLGLAPVDYWMNATCDPDYESIMDVSMERTSTSFTTEELGQMRSRLAWKVSGPSVNADSTALKVCLGKHNLARAVHQVYRSMIAQENISTLLSGLGKAVHQRAQHQHYHGGSFAHFLRSVKRVIDVDWNGFMGVLLDSIATDLEIPMRESYAQELYTQLHLLRVHSVSKLKSSPTSNPNWGKSSSFAISSKCQNVFRQIHLIFGRASCFSEHDTEDLCLTVTEDPKGWDGDSPLYASFHVPSWILLQEPDTSFVVFGLHSDIQSVRVFSEVLGLGMQVFTTALTDRTKVSVSKFMPNHMNSVVKSDTSRAAIVADTSRTFDQNLTRLVGNMNDLTGNLESFTARIDRFSQLAETKLKANAQIEIIQNHPFDLAIKIANLGEHYGFNFPTPVSKARTKIRVSRKSPWIEVTAPIADHATQQGLQSFMFVASLAGTVPQLWNMPYLSLNQLPILNTTQKSRLEWLVTLLSLQFSSMERALREKNMSVASINYDSPRVAFKDSLFSLFMQYTGVQGQEAHVFGINQTSSGGVHIIIMPCNVRLDAAHGTVVMDCLILPLSNDIMQALRPFLSGLVTRGICNIKVDAEELTLWKQMLPSFVERCRTWEHRPTCEYLVAGRIPISTTNGEQTLCSCGAGKFPPSLSPPKPKPTGFDEAKKYFTRAAISPIFSLFAAGYAQRWQAYDLFALP
ncbi:hypothetical protein MBLNU459_g1132t2 [Dothideomycetes sp. NU459]